METTPPPELAASLALPGQSLSRSCVEALQTKLDQQTGRPPSNYGDLQFRHDAVLVEGADEETNWGELEVLLEPEPGFWSTREERPHWSQCYLLSSG